MKEFIQMNEEKLNEVGELVEVDSKDITQIYLDCIRL
jgi:hypothetical protein